MKIFPQILRSFRAVFHQEKFDAEMAEEMRQHLERRREANIAGGMSPEEARYAAQRQFGGVDQLKEIAREQRSGAWLEQMVRDLRFAARQLAKSPGFTGATILILALGIGGVAAMFSTLYSVMIRPLPYPQAERLVMGVATFSGDINPMVSGPDFVDYREQSRSFSALEAFMAQLSEVTVVQGPATERATCMLVSAGLFQALCVNLSPGRSFTIDDGKAGAAPVAIISHAYWQRQFPAEPELIGRTLLIDGVARTVVGVTPPDFHFIQKADVWLPQTPQNLGPRRYNNWLLIGRLAEGTSLAEAQSDVDVIAARLEKTYPDTNTNKALLLTPLQGAFADHHRTSFMLLCAGAAAVLLIACANAAGLLLARGAGRQGELAVRAALGASQWQIMRALLAEAFLLAVGAGAFGTLLAYWIQRGLMQLLSIEALFLRDDGLSWPVLGFILSITLLTGFGFGLLPAWRARRPDLMHALKAAGGSSRHGSRLRGSLVATQVAISFMLLVIAGLLTRSLSSLQQTDPGFDAKNLLTVEVPLPARDYNGARRALFFESLLENVRALPGVRSAAAINQLPLRNPSNDLGIYELGAPPEAREAGNGYQRAVLPGYFQAMGIPLRAGRDVQPSDTSGSARVVVISQALADRILPGRDPLGRRLVIDGAIKTPWEVVGVVGDVKASSLREAPQSRGAFYRPYAQFADATMRLAIRTEVEPHALVQPLRALLQKMDARVPLSGPRTMQEVMENATVSEKAQTLCLTTFSLLALILAAVGIHGVLAYSVTQQRRDIGVRMALGANHRDVAWSIFRQAGKLALLGAGVGLLGALVISSVFRAALYGVAPQDPTVYLTSGLVLVLIAGIAAWLPARRATRVNPVEALRAN
jgi:putative ABC transport system permease protein